MSVTKQDIDDLQHLSKLAPMSMRSHTVLRRLSSLEERGLITFDPFAGEAALTEDGRQALS